jgi:hypothetical protein
MKRTEESGATVRPQDGHDYERHVGRVRIRNGGQNQCVASACHSMIVLPTVRGTSDILPIKKLTISLFFLPPHRSGTEPEMLLPVPALVFRRAVHDQSISHRLVRVRALPAVQRCARCCRSQTPRSRCLPSRRWAMYSPLRTRRRSQPNCTSRVRSFR